MIFLSYIGNFNKERKLDYEKMDGRSFGFDSLRILRRLQYGRKRADRRYDDGYADDGYLCNDGYHRYGRNDGYLGQHANGHDR